MPFKDMVVKGLTTAGGTIYTVAADKWMALATFVSANGTYFLAYTLGILVVGGVFWLGIRKLWAKRPHLKPKLSPASRGALEVTEVHSQTPVGATTRPLPPLPPLPVQPVAKPETTEAPGAEE
jgi:hypothetical protein